MIGLHTIPPTGEIAPLLALLQEREPKRIWRTLGGEATARFVTPRVLPTGSVRRGTAHLADLQRRVLDAEGRLKLL